MALLETRVLDFAIQVQQISAPTFSETERASFVYKKFLEESLSDVHMDPLGNVFARFPGRQERPALLVSAHTDTVFPAATDLTIQRGEETIAGPGIGDNSLGVAGLFGLIWSLKLRAPLPGDLWLVANVGEEGLGDLRGMKAAVEAFQSKVMAYIILEGMALGRVYHRGLGVRRYRVSACTPGGHSWVNYGRPSAIHELAAFITQINAWDLPQNPRTTWNVGRINGGVSVNTIAPNAILELDLRSESSEQLRDLTRRVEELVAACERQGDFPVQFSSEIIGDRPVGGIPANHPLVELACQSLLAQGLQPQLGIGSTDANIPLSRGFPAVCIGLTHGNGAHTKEEYIFTRPLSDGLKQLVMLVEGAYLLGLG